MKLLTDAELAEAMKIPVEHLHRLRKRYHWPCVRLGRWEYRFTDEQVEQIIAQHTEENRPDAKPVLTGQTAASARRSA